MRNPKKALSLYIKHTYDTTYLRKIKRVSPHRMNFRRLRT